MVSRPITQFFPLLNREGCNILNERENVHSRTLVDRVAVDIEDIRQGVRFKGNASREGLKVGHLNIRRLKEEKIKGITARMREWGLDIFILLDTGVTKEESVFIRKSMNEALVKEYGGEGGRVLDSPLGEVMEHRVGGQIVLISPRLAGTHVDFVKCRTGLGILMEMWIRGPGTSLALFSTYWPSTGRGPGGLHERLKEWMEKRKNRRDPMEEIREVVGGRVLAAQQRGAGTVLLGDLNMTWGKLREWA